MAKMELRIPSALKTQCIRSLAASMDSHTITHMVRTIFPGYDIYERTGFPESLAIPNQNVATQVVEDVIAENKFLSFVELLIHAQDFGIMGRRYPVSHLREIIKGTYDLGFVFDKETQSFVENPRYRRTRNWGVLESGLEYTIVFLRVDIAGNTALVKKHPADVVENTYKDLRRIVTEASEKRNGRIWLWEGDGGIVAFYFGNRHAGAVLSAMDIIHRLFIYNRVECRLSEPLKIRVGIHAGPCEYTENEEELKMHETVKEVFAVERETKLNTFNVSVVVRVMLDEFLSDNLTPVDSRKNTPYRYMLELE